MGGEFRWNLTWTSSNCKHELHTRGDREYAKKSAFAYRIPLWVGREFSVGRTYAAHPLQHRRDPGRVRVVQRARQSERVRLSASSLLRTDLARRREMSAQTHRKDVSFRQEYFCSECR